MPPCGFTGERRMQSLRPRCCSHRVSSQYMVLPNLTTLRCFPPLAACAVQNSTTLPIRPRRSIKFHGIADCRRCPTDVHRAKPTLTLNPAVDLRRQQKGETKECANPSARFICMYGCFSYTRLILSTRTVAGAHRALRPTNSSANRRAFGGSDASRMTVE